MRRVLDHAQAVWQAGVMSSSSSTSTARPRNGTGRMGQLCGVMAASLTWARSMLGLAGSMSTQANVGAVATHPPGAVAVKVRVVVRMVPVAGPDPDRFQRQVQAGGGGIDGDAAIQFEGAGKRPRLWPWGRW